MLARRRRLCRAAERSPDGRPAAFAARGAGRHGARNAELDAPFAVTLSRSSVEPFLQFAADRGLREQLFKAWVARGDNDNAHNNRAIIAETLTLRAEKARAAGL